MKTDFTKYLSYLIDKAAQEIPEGPLDLRTLKDFLDTESNPQLIKWLEDVEVFPYHVFPDGSISLNFTGCDLINWLRAKKKEDREKYV